VTTTYVSLNINLLGDLTHPGGRRNQKLTAEEFITTSLLNILMASTKYQVNHTGNGNEKQRRHFGG